MANQEYKARRVWSVVKRVLQESRSQNQKDALLESLSFFVYRSDTNALLARGILGFDAAKQKADQIRKQQGLPWSVVKFKAEPRTQIAAGSAGGQRHQSRSGVSGDGRWFTNASGQRSRVEYAPRYNPSKGRRFRGYTDAQGNFHDID
jgi:hypothetical protein